MQNRIIDMEGALMLKDDGGELWRIQFHDKNVFAYYAPECEEIKTFISPEMYAKEIAKRNFGPRKMKESTRCCEVTTRKRKRHEYARNHIKSKKTIWV